MLLDGKRILVTGVLNDQSIAFGVARVAQEQGAEVVLSSFGRIMRLTERTARKLPSRPEIVELDVTDPAHLDALAERLPFDLDGVVHAIGFAPESCLGGGFLDAPWEDVAVAMQVSAYSLKALAVAALPRLADGGAIVGLDFDNQHHAWPVYDWMGVAKAAFESTARYLARSSGRGTSGSTSWLRVPCARSRRARSPASTSSRRSGTSGRRSAGTSATPSPPRAPSSRCCPTGSPPRRARSSTSTAATTRSAPEPPARTELSAAPRR